MKKISLRILLLASFALLAPPFTARAIVPLTVQVETGAQVDKATTIVKNVNEGGRVVTPQPKDTNFLFTGEPMSSLAIYNMTSSNGLFMVTSKTELMDALQAMEEAVFSQHVNASKNEIADWLVSIDKNAAEKMRAAKTKQEAVTALSEFIPKQ